MQKEWRIIQMLYFGVGLNNNECKKAMSINKGSLKKVKIGKNELTYRRYECKI